MGRIRILDEHIANQIAAGEVVERPASVVKELVENAIDAGSTAIDVAVEEGGLQSIRVTDNGSGMEPDDCETAFQRHATSKIASGKDLFHIRTLGFRGEALPSISAVAKVECTTATDSGGLGRFIRIEGGAVRDVGEKPAAKGTDLVVRELFYNTPARLKYMKTIQTELGHISDFMYRLALARPDIAFTLKHNGNMLLQTLGNGDVLQVAAAVYGAATAKAMVPISVEHPDYVLTGIVSRPELTRANRSGITVVVNGRYIRNYAVNGAIQCAYHTLLPINRHPMAVLHIRMDPSLADVNVHPAKMEVRFSKEAELIELVEAEIRRAIGRQVLIPEASKPAPRPELIREQLAFYGTAAVEPAAFPSAPREPAAPQPREARERDGAAGPGFPAAGPEPAGRTPHTGSAAPAPAVRPVPGQRQPAPGASSAALGWTPEKWAEAVNGPERKAPPSLPAFPKLYPIGQMHGTYILAQNQDGLYMIDQHAAHERINYEYYYEKFGRPAEASQQLLVPITLDFTSAEAAALRERLPLFEQAGVVLEHFGGSSFLVRAYPHWFPKGEEQAVIEEMAEWLLAEKKSIDLLKLREKSAVLCSCKASVKANQSLSTAEIEGLLERLAACANPYTCPHGRPIVVSFSTYELEKMFKRVM